MTNLQIGGVRFLYDNVIESGEQYMNSQGFGCILAHAMGLGKTIQVCTFCDVFLRSTTGEIFHYLHAKTSLKSSSFSFPRGSCPLHRPHKHHSELAG